MEVVSAILLKSTKSPSKLKLGIMQSDASSLIDLEGVTMLWTYCHALYPIGCIMLGTFQRSYPI